MTVDYCYSLEKDEFLGVLTRREINTVFQPIVSLKSGEILGYEALSRGPKNTYLESPFQLFNLADSLGKNWELECLCLDRALENFSSFDSDKLLFLNVNPNVLLTDYKFCRLDKRPTPSMYQIKPEKIIFELTEKNSIFNYKKFQRILYYYLNRGFRFAIDDAGSGYSGLNLLVNTKPQFVKIDLELIKTETSHNIYAVKIIIAANLVDTRILDQNQPIELCS